ncbi:MAG: SWIM zinc finger family protein [Actinomycetota bacterium]|nr:SWIM zinc finger family protein [Actinomycetota bacterium]
MSDVPGRAFRNAFARRSVEAMADRRSFERGLLYAANGRVGKRTLTASTVKAKVRGSSSYQVELSLDDDPAYDCSCPVGQESRFCKHAVAVALVVTDAVADPGQRAEAVIDVRGYLEGLDHPTLVDLLVERAADDDIFDARLRMDAARATAGPPQLGVFRHAIDEAFVVHDYVGYRDMYAYATNINTVLDSLQDLLDDRHAETVVALAEHAIDRAEDAVGSVDDSDGRMSGIAERLQDLHLAACASLQPDPVTLARTLFDRERHSGDLEVFYGAASAYAEVLGRRGPCRVRPAGSGGVGCLATVGPQGRGARLVVATVPDHPDHADPGRDDR